MVRVMVGPARSLAPIGHAIGPVIVRVPRPKPLRPFVSRFAPWGIKVTNSIAGGSRTMRMHRVLPVACQPYGRGCRHSAACTAAGSASIERRVVLRRGIRRSTAALPVAY